MYDPDGGAGADLGIALPAVGSAISAIGGVFGGSKDGERLAWNKKGYDAGIARQPIFTGADYTAPPLQWLLYRSPTSKGGGGGWATSVAQNDAYAKYTALKSALVTAPPPPPISAYQQPAPKPIGGPVVGGLATGPLVVAGLAAAGIFLLSGKRRR